MQFIYVWNFRWEVRDWFWWRFQELIPNGTRERLFLFFRLFPKNLTQEETFKIQNSKNRSSRFNVQRWCSRWTRSFPPRSEWNRNSLYGLKGCEMRSDAKKLGRCRPRPPTFDPFIVKYVDSQWNIKFPSNCWPHTLPYIPATFLIRTTSTGDLQPFIESTV